MGPASKLHRSLVYGYPPLTSGVWGTGLRTRKTNRMFTRLFTQEYLMSQHRLGVGGRFTGITVEPDGQWPGMWRVHKGDHISDMVNLTRAKDAAIAWARPRGLGGNEDVRWDRRETASESP